MGHQPASTVAQTSHINIKTHFRQLRYLYSKMFTISRASIMLLLFYGEKEPKQYRIGPPLSKRSLGQSRALGAQGTDPY